MTRVDTSDIAVRSDYVPIHICRYRMELAHPVGTLVWNVQ